MSKMLIFALMAAFGTVTFAFDNEHGMKNDFSNRDGRQVVRTMTPGEGSSPSLLERNRPIRNPNILAQVIWVDRNHEFAIAENVTTTPDGSSIFAGWWLNNMRFAAYSSAGLEIPLWRYNQQTPWMMPVAATDANYSGTGANLPAFIWNHDSPLFIEQYNFDVGYTGAGVSFSGDGNLLAMVSATGLSDAVLVIYDMTTQDTVLTRHFEPIQGLYGVDISLNGSVAVASAYGQLYVYEIPSGTLRGTLYNYSQGTAKISADGSRIANGTYTGAVYLYEWDGAEYDTHWIRATGHDWVTAIDISDDGSTVACGTLDFVNNQIAGGKFDMWDGDSGNELIDYEEYGDMVASVALSSTGQYAIAGCWGKYETTFGDVVSCFIRDSSLPIFQLADDLDEPGSVFGVAISDSGHYAAAGGKAVHAREFGNGGMLYSIKIRDPLANDVAVASIDEPGEFLAPDEAAIPTATYINVGLQQVSFATACTITNLDNNQVVYTGAFNVTDLPSFQTSQVFYPSFTMPGDGRFSMVFSAYLSNDDDPGNNDLALVIRSWHDMQGVTIESPFDEITINWSVAPVATFKNLGSYFETAEITVSIQDSIGSEIFSSSAMIYDLEPYAQEEVQFDGWIPSAKGLHRAVFTANVADDHTPGDNSISKDFAVVEEMIYDDGAVDAAYWVDVYPNSTNRKFAQRFEPNLFPPATITNVRFFQPNVTYSGIFDYIQITDELGGFPDTADYLDMIEFPSLPGPNNWASFDLARGIYTDDPLWMVIHWADIADAGPYIGADNTGNIERQSYWYSDAAGWNQFLFYDWMIRMTLRQGVGVESDYYSGLPRKITLAPNYPNPFNPSTILRFGLPNAGHARLEVFDMLGRRVRILADEYFESGFHSMLWDGANEDGSDASSGAYYYRLTSAGQRVSRRMILAK
jgi:WD40 repeat protein